MTIDKIPERQLNVGPAGWFKVEPESPAGNQVVLKAGFAFAGADRLIDAFTGGDQTSAGFSGVSGAGFKRWDLVYLNASGVVTVLAGNEVASGAPVFDGAPGFNLGPNMPDQCVPAAYVLIDEVSPAPPVITESDITRITGFAEVTRSLNGYLVDKGLFGAAPGGASDVVTALFASETAGGGTAVKGVVTAPPENYVHLLDQNSDEITHTTGAKMYGRLTEAAGVWTLAYFYIDGTGAETSMDPSADTGGPAPTDLQLVGVPKVYSANDPARPLFDSNVARLSDQLVGTIPDGSETVKGKVEFAPSGGTASLEAVQGNDSRLGAVTGRANAGAVSGLQPVVRLIQGANVTVSLLEAGGELQFTIAAAAAGGGNTNAVASLAYVATLGNPSFNPAFATNANMAVVLTRDSGNGAMVGVCIGAGGVTAQGCLTIDGIGGTEQAAFVDGVVAAFSNSPFNQYTYSMTSFTNALITMTRAGADVVTTITGRILVLGQ